jgi:hypothetical protein
MSHEATNTQAEPFERVAALVPAPLQGVCVDTSATRLPESADAAREQFAQFRALAFSELLSPEMFALLKRLCDTGTFVSDQAGPGHREVESPQRAGQVLNLALSRAPFLGWLQEATGCGPLREIAGRVVQTLPRPGDELRWHDDVDHERRLAVVINLGEQVFAGGEFELRRKGGERVLQYEHTRPGSALIFRVHSKFEHRVLPLTAGGPRRVYTGWAV